MIACGLILTLPFTSSLGFAQSALSEANPQRTLLMGTEADYIPFAYRYPSELTSEIIGFDIDLANYIAQQLGVRLEIREMAFEQLLPLLQSGELDFVIAAITPTTERQQYFDFSDAYFESRHALVSRRSRPVRTLADLAGNRIVVQRGSVQERAIWRQIESGLAVEVLSLTRMKAIVTAVRESRADVALIEELVAEAYLENNPTLVMDVLGEIEPTPVAVAFPPGSAYVDGFNQVLAEMRASGELQRLVRQWFTADP